MVNFSQEAEQQYEKVICSKEEISGTPLDVSGRIIIVNDATRPNHYGGKDSVYEVFNVLEAWGLDKDFYLGNVIKYVARAGKKSKTTEKEDLQKALVYLQRRIDTL
jgi:hypothetical protein